MALVVSTGRSVELVTVQGSGTRSFPRNKDQRKFKIDKSIREKDEKRSSTVMFAAGKVLARLNWVVHGAGWYAEQ